LQFFNLTKIKLLLLLCSFYWFCFTNIGSYVDLSQRINCKLLCVENVWKNCFITGTWGPNKIRKMSATFLGSLVLSNLYISINMWAQNVTGIWLSSFWQASWKCLVVVLCRSSFDVSLTMCWSNKMASVNYYWWISQNVSWISFFSFTRAYVTVLENSFLTESSGSIINGEMFLKYLQILYCQIYVSNLQMSIWMWAE
jgi:hypothetical protein